MAGNTKTPHQISLFRSQITTRRFNDESLRILESLLVFKDSCLALKYEALLFRDVKSTSDQSLHVSYLEWLNFAHHLLDQGFYSIATQACEKALACFQKKDVADAKTCDFFENARVIEDIKRLKDRAMKSAASGSVQSQAAEYLKRKIVEKSRICSFRTETKSAASTLFRNGIKKRHERELRKHQNKENALPFHSIKRTSRVCRQERLLFWRLLRALCQRVTLAKRDSLMNTWYVNYSSR
ncbi:hypothetical protein DKX38_024925 [Salix brachista]|uniref:Uncharacterized protein n=1 Tax=Salix brachista TaxID=2182728 RepID=A0A5N5JPH8_9ROSI|nr:hypothetical protein DKX38_024925 [Salix brachista]